MDRAADLLADLPETLKNAPFVNSERNGLRVCCLEPLVRFDLRSIPWDVICCRGAEPIEGVRVVKRSRTRCVAETEIHGFDEGPIRVFAKRYKVVGPIKRLLSLVHRSKARREFEVGWKAIERRLPTAIPLAWAEERRFGILSNSYLITLGIDRAHSFHDIWTHLDTGEERRTWMRGLGQFIRQAHERGFAHDDLSTDHVLVGPGANEDAPPRLHFIDLDQSRMGATVRPMRRAHNFFQIFRSLPPGMLTPDMRKAFYGGYSDDRWQDEHIRTFERAVETIRTVKKVQNLFKPKKWFKR